MQRRNREFAAWMVGIGFAGDILAVVGGLLLVAGTDNKLVAAWLVEMGSDVGDADDLGTQIFADLMLRHTKTAGEG